ELQVYARHWEDGLAGDAAEAAAHLDQVEIDLERVPANVRYRRRFRQSELAESLEILTRAQERMNRAKALITHLEEERNRLSTLRENLENALHTLIQEDLPSLSQLADQMLPELQQRLAEIKEELSQAPSLFDPAQVDYDKVTETWLPSLRRQIAEIREAHESDIRHYQEMLQRAQRRLEKEWSRLERLGPREQPGLGETLDKLETDLEKWFSRARQEANNPLALRELVGKRAELLEERIAGLREQLIQGRQTLDELAKQFQRHAQSVRNLRAAIQTMQANTPWSQLLWDTDEAEQAWEETVHLERNWRTSPTLLEAIDRLRQAVHAAQRAEGLYARLEQQMGDALRHLDTELKEVQSTIRRLRRNAIRLGESGDSEGQAELEEACATATRLIEMAHTATTFEDALRHLRRARETLE
ncbi:MAG: hypothetical protein J7M05_14320, partial [Anaerolineae bacterium]|nr:hypothetical protein [Anaerolineae bacterium]